VLQSEYKLIKVVDMPKAQSFYVYLSAEHTYSLEPPSMEFVVSSVIPRNTLISEMDITEFPCLVQIIYDGVDDTTASATILPISLLRCDEPEIEYED